MLKLAALLVLAAAATGAHGAARRPLQAAQAPGSVLDVIKADPQTSDLYGFVQQYRDVASQLAQLGSTAGTFFAPTNSALAAAMARSKAAGKPLTNERLRDILLYHIVPGPPAPVTQLNDAQVFVTALAEPAPAKTLTARYDQGRLTVQGVGSGASIVTPDIFVGPAQYAVVHVVDNMLLPYTLPGSVQLASGGGGPSGGAAAGGAGPRGPRVPVVTTPGIVDAASLEADTAGMGGAADALGGAAGAKGTAAAEYATVLDAAASADLNLTRLAGAVSAAGLSALFGNDFTGTLFAPVDAAFEALLDQAASLGVTPSKELLADVLALHVLNTTLVAADLEDGQQLETADGRVLKVVKQGGGVYIEDPTGQLAEVLTADVTIGSGAVVHTLASVLLPAPLEAAAPAPAPGAATVAAPTAAGTSAVASVAALAASLLGVALLLP